MPIDMKEFDELPEYKQAQTIETKELLAALSEMAMDKHEVAELLGIADGSAYTRLKKLEDKEFVVRRRKGKKTYWAATGKMPEEVIEPEE